MSTIIEEIAPAADRHSIHSRTSSSQPSSASSISNEKLPGAYHSSTSSLQFRPFQSRLITGPAEKPWLEEKRKGRNWAKIFPWTGVVIGLLAGAALVYDGYRTINPHKYCLAFEDDFSGASLDTSKWSYDVQVGGYGNGQFEWTTDSTDNTFIKDGMLNIQPTLTDKVLTDAQISNGYTLNLTADGTCTSSDPYACVVRSNTTTAELINPVRSARISTRKSASIKYGRVEVVAKLPKGDWLWPAIWMMPRDSVYGDWPRSGEIDIAEGRGNDRDYLLGGRDTIGSALHWGPESDMDAYYLTTRQQELQRGDYSQKFHTFGLEWTDKYLYTYVDNRLRQVLYVPFAQPRWKQGHFPAKNVNNTPVVDIWSQTGEDSTPFDQEFYLILNVAVGGTNGWFRDSEASKPWVDQSATAMRDFWAAKDKWFPTWSGNSAMQVKSVRMYQQCG